MCSRYLFRAWFQAALVVLLFTPAPTLLTGEVGAAAVLGSATLASAAPEERLS